MSSNAEHGMATRTLRGVFWAYGSYAVGRLLVLLSIAILARLLSPEDFGLVGFAVTFIVLLEAISDLGVSQALIVVPEADLEERARTAWSVSVLLGVVLAATCAALSPAVAAFFDEPQLVAMLSVLGLNFVMRSFSQTHFAIAQKRIDFRTRTVAELTDVVVRGVTGVALALSGAGAWSLILGYLAGALAMTIALWLLVPFRPRWRIERESARSLLRFGGGLTALDIFSAIIANVDYVFVGRVLGAVDLGLYTLGFRLPELLILNVSSVAGVVLFPAFAGVAGERRLDAYLLSLRYVLMISVPLTLGLILLAEPLTYVAFGPQWEESVPAVRVLAIFAFAVTVGIPAGTAYKAAGRVDVLLKLVVPRAILAVGSIWIFVDDGIVAVATCQAAVAGLFSVIGIGLASRLLAGGVRGILSAIWPPVVAGTAMAVPVALLDRALDHDVLTLATAIPAGAAIYGAAMWIVAPNTIRGVLATAFPGRAAR